MKKEIFTLLFCFGSLISNAQNLVSNPGFETYLTCPAFGQFSNIFIQDWNKPTVGSSDYYHFNCPGIQPQLQSPMTGEAYAGIIGYNYGTEYREYVTGTFINPLIAGHVYDVEFYVSLHDGYIQAIQELGAYISVTAPGPFTNALHLNVVPQVEHTNGTITDTSGWKHVYGQFTALGGEQYITIGNFHDDLSTTITQPGTSGSYGAYYFLDDVSVKDSGSPTGLQNDAAQPFIIQCLGNVLEIQNASGRIMKVAVYDFAGRIVGGPTAVIEDLRITLPDAAAFYAVTIIANDKPYYKIVNRTIGK